MGHQRLQENDAADIAGRMHVEQVASSRDFSLLAAAGSKSQN
jgi:hypothetical protein